MDIVLPPKRSASIVELEEKDYAMYKDMRRILKEKKILMKDFFILNWLKSRNILDIRFNKNSKNRAKGLIDKNLLQKMRDVYESLKKTFGIDNS